MKINDGQLGKVDNDLVIQFGLVVDEFDEWLMIYDDL